jgi:hypothetical protein
MSGNAMNREAGRSIGVWALVIALLAAAFVIGRLTGGRGHRESWAPPFVENAELRKVAVRQLEDAATAKKWTDEQHAAFIHNLAPLSPKSRTELLGTLVGLINSNTVRVEHPPSPPEPPRCPYVPGPCLDPPKSDTPASGKARAL